MENKLVSQPEIVVDAVELLLSVLNNEQKSNIVAMKEGELFDLHFTLGLVIRNAFGLHDLGSKLIADCGVVPPDSGAGVITLNLWKMVMENHVSDNFKS